MGAKGALRRSTILIAVLLAAVTASSLSALTLMPGNTRTDADPAARAEMARTTLQWGRLAPFPATARDFGIRSEGGLFTRSFRGSFSDTPAHVEAWLAASPGVARGGCTPVPEGERCVLRTARDVGYGELVLSKDKSHVTFYASWS
jgi:hypothetical protein